MRYHDNSLFHFQKQVKCRAFGFLNARAIFWFVASTQKRIPKAKTSKAWSRNSFNKWKTKQVSIGLFAFFWVACLVLKRIISFNLSIYQSE